MGRNRGIENRLEKQNKRQIVESGGGELMYSTSFLYEYELDSAIYDYDYDYIVTCDWLVD
jgi:hypothetical protein